MIITTIHAQKKENNIKFTAEKREVLIPKKRYCLTRMNLQLDINI